MIALLTKIKKVPGGPIVQGVVALAFLAVCYYVIRALYNSGKRLLNPPVDPEELVQETPTQDGTQPIPSEIEAYQSTAQTIAQGQFVAMDMTGTDEMGLFNGVVNLNGWQLQQVYAEYGIKQGKNLFEWYQSELGDGIFSGGVYWCGATGLNCTDGQVPGCESWSDNCYEADFMRAIWEKSGLPITF